MSCIIIMEKSDSKEKLKIVFAYFQKDAALSVRKYLPLLSLEETYFEISP